MKAYLEGDFVCFLRDDEMPHEFMRELTQTELDAERYRWLRKDFDSDIAVVIGLGATNVGSSGVAYTYEDMLYGEYLDAAIDTAMTQTHNASLTGSGEKD